MSAELVNIIRSIANGNYLFSSSYDENGAYLTFERNHKKYRYTFCNVNSYPRLPYYKRNQNDYIVSAHDSMAHEEFQHIFSKSLYEQLNEKINRIGQDINFMYYYCFSQPLNFYPDTLLKIAKKNTVYNVLEYYHETIDEKSDSDFYLMMAIRFNSDSKVFDHVEEYRYNLVQVSSHDWTVFKKEFIQLFAANVLGKSIVDLTLSDSIVLNMINI